MVKRVISGAQTGADLGGLIAAKLFGLETGGSMPFGYKSHLGSTPEYAELFDIQEHSSPGYPPRTEENVFNADGTVRIASYFESAGEKCTLRAIKKAKSPYFDVPVDTETPIVEYDRVVEFADWIKDNDIVTLNVAGNSHKTWAGMQLFTIEFLSAVFLHLGYNKLLRLPNEYWRFAERRW